jgi:hypothetical protein
MGGPHQVSTTAEEIVDRAMSRKKSLGLPRRFEPPHLAPLLARRLMRHFGSFVRSFVVAVGNTGQEFSMSRPIAAQLFGYQPAWDIV